MKSGKIIFLKVELIDFINGLDVGCERKRRVKIDQLFCPGYLQEWCCNILRYWEDEGTDFFEGSRWMGESLKFNFVHGDLKCLVDIK